MGIKHPSQPTGGPITVLIQQTLELRLDRGQGFDRVAIGLKGRLIGHPGLIQQSGCIVPLVGAVKAIGRHQQNHSEKDADAINQGPGVFLGPTDDFSG